MVSLYRKHLFICENLRDQSDSRGAYSQKGSPDFRIKLKEVIERRSLKAKIRINKAGCLGMCKQGISLVIYSEGICYGKITESDMPDIIEKALLINDKIDRLLMPFMRKET